MLTLNHFTCTLLKNLQGWGKTLKQKHIISSLIFLFKGQSKQINKKQKQKQTTKYATEKDKFVSRDSNPRVNIRSIHPTQLPIDFITEKIIPYNSSESFFKVE